MDEGGEPGQRVVWRPILTGAGGSTQGTPPGALALFRAVVFAASVFGAPAVFAQAAKDKGPDKEATKDEAKPREKLRKNQDTASE